METEKQTNENGLAGVWAGGMALAAGLIRLVPHPWNFTPIGALGLFGGARLRSWRAYVLLFAVMAVSDLLLYAIHGMNYTPFNPWVYACFALSIVWGQLFLRTGSAWRIGLVSVLVSVQFFLVTNFISWWTFSVPFTQPDGTVMAPLYTRNMSGLMASYIAALPFVGTNAPPLGFFGNQLLGDLFYSAVLFGAYAWMHGGVFGSRHPRALSTARTT